MNVFALNGFHNIEDQSEINTQNFESVFNFIIKGYRKLKYLIGILGLLLLSPFIFLFFVYFNTHLYIDTSLKIRNIKRFILKLESGNHNYTTEQLENSLKSYRHFLDFSSKIIAIDISKLKVLFFLWPFFSQLKKLTVVSSEAEINVRKELFPDEDFFHLTYMEMKEMNESLKDLLDEEDDMDIYTNKFNECVNV